MDEFTITLTREERDILIIQIGARIMTFEDLMCQAAQERKTDRVMEVSEMIKNLKNIQNKLY